MTLPANFTAKTVQSTCTVWVGATNNQGYGVVMVDGVADLVHRIAYVDTHGPIPPGYVIDHRCRVRNCVRADHLEAVTQGENQRRGRIDGGLQVGDSCINGHALHSAAAIYTRPSGETECRACRDAGNHGKKRPTIRNRAADARAVHTT